MTARKKQRPRLRVVGRSEILLAPIRERARRDLDFDIEFELIDDIEGLQRAVTRPDSFDVYHQWHTIDLIWTARAIQAIDLTRIDNGRTIKAMADGGRGDARLIGTVFDKLFVGAEGNLGRTPSDRVSMLPSIHGVDAFGYVRELRSELNGPGAESWAWLLDPRLHGRVAIMGDPVLGMIEAALAAEASQNLTLGDIGNLTIEEIDLVANLLVHKKKVGHFRGIWRNYEESSRLMQKGGVVLQSMFSPALTMLRRHGFPVVLSVPQEGCRGWHADLCISSHADGVVLDAAYEYLNWWMNGWALSVLTRQGYYATLPELVRPYLSDAERGYWYEGLPATEMLLDPFGEVCVHVGERREGGAHLERMSRVRVWNTFMDEHTYLVRRWREFVEA